MTHVTEYIKQSFKARGAKKRKERFGLGTLSRSVLLVRPNSMEAYFPLGRGDDVIAASSEPRVSPCFSIKTVNTELANTMSISNMGITWSLPSSGTDESKRAEERGRKKRR